MINRVVLVGRLTKDPELKYTPSGAAVANFTLAVNRSFQSASGEKETDFILCQVWRKQAENTANFLKKGSLAGVEGRIQTRNYEGQDGKRVYITEVIADSVQFLEPKSSQEGREGSGNTQQQQSQQRQPQGQQNQNNSYQNQQGSYQQQQNNNNGYNAPPMGDPFNGGPIEVSDDNLPF